MKYLAIIFTLLAIVEVSHIINPTMATPITKRICFQRCLFEYNFIVQTNINFKNVYYLTNFSKNIT